MNSKECLNKILDMLNYEQVNECEKNNYLKTIKQDLDRLKNLEIANKNNEGLVRENTDLINRNLELEKEKQEVETRLSSKETNTFDEIATMIKKSNSYDVLVNKCKQLEKALEILQEVVSLNCDNTLETERQFIRLSKEEYETLKEVFYDD